MNAIEKLKQLANDNKWLADEIETGKVPAIQDMPPQRVANLISTYRYWSQCLLIAAWLLESDQSAQQTVGGDGRASPPVKPA